MDQHVTALVTAARDILKAHGYFVDNLWHVDDVHFMCEQHNLAPVSDEEAMEIFGIANEQFDGEHGISWPRLEKALHTYLHRKAVLNSLCPAEKVEPGE